MLSALATLRESSYVVNNSSIFFIDFWTLKKLTELFVMRILWVDSAICRGSHHIS